MQDPDPHTVQSLLDRGERLLELAAFEAAADCLERAAAGFAPGDPGRTRALGLALEARADRARQHVHAQRFPLAEQEVARALVLDPRRAELLWLRARLAERSGRIDEALEDLAMLDALHVRSVTSTLLEASCRAQLDDAPAFDAVMKRAAALATEHPCAIASGRVEALLDAPGTYARPVDAVGRMRRAVSLRPGDPVRRTVLAELLLDAGWVQEAELHLVVALSADPGNVAATLLAGRASLERRDVAGALEHFAAVPEPFGGYPDRWLWIALARFQARQFTLALEMLRRALDLNRRYAAAWQALAIMRFTAGDGAGAALAARQLTLRHRNRPAYSGAFYRALAEEPDDAALRELRRAAALHPEYPDISEALAVALKTRAGGRRDGNTNGARFEAETHAVMEVV